MAYMVVTKHQSSLGPHTYSHIALWTKRVFRGTVLDLNRHLLKVKTIKSSFNCMTKLKYYSTISLMHLRYELNNCSINGSVQNGVISTTVHYYKVTRSYVSRSWSRVRLSSTMFIVMSNDIYMNVLLVTWPISAGNGLQIFGRNILYHFLNDVDISTFSINLIIYWTLFKYVQQFPILLPDKQADSITLLAQYRFWLRKIL